MKTATSAAMLAAFLCAAGSAAAQGTQAGVPDTTSSSARQESTAGRHVTAAVEVARKLEADERMRAVLRDAKGVFIVPSYSRAALGVGGAGGAGVLLVRKTADTWSDPVFYSIGGLSVGLQAGVQHGAFALLLTNDKAVQAFLKKNNVTLDAKAGITIVNWSRQAQTTASRGDVVAWSATRGLFGDAVTLEVNDIRFDQQLTNAYYRRTLSASDVIAARAANPQAEPLLQAVAAAAGAAR